MRLATFTTPSSKTTSVVGAFLGLNQNLIANDGEFSSMKNVSDRFYPALSNRPSRGAIQKTFTNPKGILYKNGLFYIDGTNAYYNNTQRFTVTNTDKTIVGMGAYICVFPDGIMYNTFTNTTEYMAASQSQNGTATFAPLSTGSAFTKITMTGLNKFKQGDAVTITGCTKSTYNGTHIVSEAGSNYIVISGKLSAQFTQTSGIKFERQLPSMDFVAERDNRLWGCSSANHEIYSCKLGDPKNWKAYETGADMAYAATIGSDGDFTACVGYSSYILFFKENVVHILRGNKPSNYSISEKDLPGVRKGCSKSVEVINEVLYYVGLDGVYAFDGALPQKISSNIKETITDAVSCQYEGKLYISCLLGGARTLLVYDPSTKIWDVENNERFMFADSSEGMLYFVDGNKKLTSIYGSRPEKVEWEFETCDIQDGMLNGSFLTKSAMKLQNNYVSNIKLNLWLATGTEVTVYMKCDDGPMWDKKAFIRSTANKTYTIPIRPVRCSKYRLKVEGFGEFKLIAMSNDVEQGSEFNGNIQRQHNR